MFEILYVVIEEDRGLGNSVIGVFSNSKEAHKIADDSKHYYVVESDHNMLETLD